MTAAATAPDDVTAEATITAALREILDTFDRMDAVERGMQFFNPNHDPHSGQFTTGGAGGVEGGTGGGLHAPGGIAAEHGSHSHSASSSAGGGGGSSKAADATSTTTSVDHHWSGKSTWGNWSSSHKGLTAEVDAHNGKVVLGIHHGNGTIDTHLIEADHEYGGYKATNTQTGKVAHGLTLKGANDYVKGEIGGIQSTHGTALLKGGKIFDATMIEAPGAKPNAAQKALNKANEFKLQAKQDFDLMTKHGAKSAPVYSNGQKTVEYHKPDGSMVHVERNPDDKSYTVKVYNAKPAFDAQGKPTISAAESWLNAKEGNGGAHSYENKPAKTTVYKTEKGVQNALDKQNVNMVFKSGHLYLHNPQAAVIPSAPTSSKSSVSPHSTTGWKNQMAANLAAGKVVAEASPVENGIGRYNLTYGHGAEHIQIVAIGAGKQDVEISYTKGGHTKLEHYADASEAKAGLTANGIKDEQAHAFVDMARHDMDSYSGKATPAQQTRIDEVKALKSSLDAKYGMYSKAEASKQVQAIYKAYPEVRTALSTHLGGGAHFQESSIATANHTTGLSKAEKLARAKEGLQKLREVSQWSLLHQGNVTREGTIRLFHGTNGHSSPATWKTRLESSAARRGTPMTDHWSIARQFADAGAHGRLIVSSHVPVEAIPIWHGVRGDSMYSHEREFTVGTGAIKDYSILDISQMKS